MDITLPPDLESYVDQSVRRGAFTSANELIQEALRRKMEEDAWMEQKVLEAEESDLTPLTREDLKSVRDFWLIIAQLFCTSPSRILLQQIAFVTQLRPLWNSWHCSPNLAQKPGLRRQPTLDSGHCADILIF